MNFVVLDAKGEVVRRGICPPGDLSLQAGDGESVMAAPDGVDLDNSYFANGEWLAYPARPNRHTVFKVETGAWVDERTPAQIAADLTRAKASAVSRVNDWAATERAKYITIIPGQEMIYLAKEAEAIRYLSDPAPVLAAYPMISAEVGITAETPYQLAQVWAYMSGLWRSVAAQIETARLGSIAQIEAAPNAETLDGLMAAIMAGLQNG
jgi:hypothetical protein